MLIPKVYIPQVGILAGHKVLELDCSRGVLIRRIKAAELLTQIQAEPNAPYLYLKLSKGNLQDKTLPKLLDKLHSLNPKLYIVTDSPNAEGLAAILHACGGIELNFANIQPQEIQRVCLLAATRKLQLNLKFEQMPDLASFLPLFAQLPLSSINVYLPNLDELGELPDNVRVFEISK